jgi:MoxR-like ATPase
METLGPSELLSLLSRTIPARLPILITGSPGVSKSDIVAQAAQAAGADLIISHPAVADPTDAKGLPWAVPGPDGSIDHATFLPFGDLAMACRAEKPTVWFLDDLGQAPPAVQASYMQLLLARRVNGHRLPEHVVFIAATNRRTDRAGVQGILEPVKSRFAAIVELRPKLDPWCEWALDHGVDPLYVAAIRFRPELLSDFRPSADLEQSPSPRTHVHAAKLIALGLPSAIETAAVSGAIGAGAAAEILAYIRMARELPSPDVILLDPSGSPLPDRPAALYATVTALAARTTPATFRAISIYAQRLMDAQHGEFAALLTRDALRRCPQIAATGEFIRLATGPLGQLVQGASGGTR